MKSSPKIQFRKTKRRTLLKTQSTPSKLQFYYSQQKQKQKQAEKKKIKINFQEIKKKFNIQSQYKSQTHRSIFYSIDQNRNKANKSQAKSYEKINPIVVKQKPKRNRYRKYISPSSIFYEKNKQCQTYRSSFKNEKLKQDIFNKTRYVEKNQQNEVLKKKYPQTVIKAPGLNSIGQREIKQKFQNKEANSNINIFQGSKIYENKMKRKFQIKRLNHAYSFSYNTLPIGSNESSRVIGQQNQQSLQNKSIQVNQNYIPKRRKIITEYSQNINQIYNNKRSNKQYIEQLKLSSIKNQLASWIHYHKMDMKSDHLQQVQEQQSLNKQLFKNEKLKTIHGTIEQFYQKDLIFNGQNQYSFGTTNHNQNNQNYQIQKSQERYSNQDKYYKNDNEDLVDIQQIQLGQLKSKSLKSNNNNTLDWIRIQNPNHFQQYYSDQKETIESQKQSSQRRLNQISKNKNKQTITQIHKQNKQISNPKNKEQLKNQIMILNTQLEDLQKLGDVAKYYSQNLKKSKLNWYAPVLLLYKQCLNYFKQVQSVYIQGQKINLIKSKDLKIFQQQNEQIKKSLQKMTQHLTKKNKIKEDVKKVLDTNYKLPIFNEVHTHVILFARQSIDNQYINTKQCQIGLFKMLQADIIIMQKEGYKLSIQVFKQFESLTQGQRKQHLKQLLSIIEEKYLYSHLKSNS